MSEVDSNKIISLMQARGLTIEDVAEQMGKDESGRKKTPQGVVYIMANRSTKQKTLNRLAGVLGVKAVDLMTQD